MVLDASIYHVKQIRHRSSEGAVRSSAPDLDSTISRIAHSDQCDIRQGDERVRVWPTFSFVGAGPVRGYGLPGW